MLIDTDLIIKRFKQLNTELKGGVTHEQKAKKILQKTWRPESLSRWYQTMMTAHPGRGNPLLFHFWAGAASALNPLSVPEMDRKGRDPPGAGRQAKLRVGKTARKVRGSGPSVWRSARCYNQSLTINQNLYHVT